MADTSELSELTHASEIIPRHTPSNPYNYNGAQLAERKKTLKDLAEVYPNLPFAWLEMVYDFEKNTYLDHRRAPHRSRIYISLSVFYYFTEVP